MSLTPVLSIDTKTRQKTQEVESEVAVLGNEVPYLFHL